MFKGPDLDLFRNYRFNYRQLTSDQKAVYIAINNAIINYDKEVKFPERFLDNITVDLPNFISDKGEAIIWISEYVRQDCPLLFHFKLTECYTEPNTSVTHLSIEYDFSKQEYDKIIKEISEVVTKFFNERILGQISDYEIEMIVHHYLVNNVKYDEQDALDELKDSSILGPLLYGKGKCAAYAYTTSLLLNSFGIPCSCIVGKKLEVAGNKMIESNVYHLWNIVLIEDNWYHLDTTWDSTLKHDEFPKYDYFNINDELCSNDHLWYVKTNCNSYKYNYHVKNNLVAKDYKSFREILEKERLKGNLSFTVRLIYSSRDDYEKCVRLIDSGLMTSQKRYSSSYNDLQQIMWLCFYDYKEISDD